MWTIRAYDIKGDVVPGFMATNNDEIAFNAADRLASNPLVSVVIAEYVRKPGVPATIVVLESGWFVRSRPTPP